MCKHSSPFDIPVVEVTLDGGVDTLHRDEQQDAADHVV